MATINENDIGLVLVVDFQSHQENEDVDILHVTTGEKAAWNEKAGGSAFNTHKGAATLDHPNSSVTAEKIASGAVTNEKLADAVKNRITTLEGHQASTENPHQTSKAQVGLGNVDDVQQATKAEFDSHKNNADIHTTAEQKAAWNEMISYKLTPGENITIDENNVISAVVPAIVDIPYLSIDGQILYATTFVEVLDGVVFLRGDGAGDHLLTITPNGSIYAKDLIRAS